MIVICCLHSASQLNPPGRTMPVTGVDKGKMLLLSKTSITIDVLPMEGHKHWAKTRWCFHFV